MGVAIDRRIGMPEVRVAGVTRGVGLVIINRSGELWVQQDLEDRSQTGRRAGDLSFPFETEKHGESVENNVLGAISEIVNDETLPLVANNLYTTDSLQSSPRLYSHNTGRPIDYALSVVVFTGEGDVSLAPHDKKEARPYGWMKADELLANNNVRPLAVHAAEHLAKNRTIERVLTEFHDESYPKRLVIPSWYTSVERFHNQREQLQDMNPGVVYSIGI